MSGEGLQRDLARLNTEVGFAEKTAHEFGHSVLQEAEGTSTAFRHKGSSSLFQTTLDTAPTYPAMDEIDLML